MISLAASTLALALLAGPTELAPWQVGPAPSAQPVARSWSVGLDLGGLIAPPKFPHPHPPLPGARASVGVAPHERFWTSLELGYGTTWRPCIDCRALGLTWTARGLIVRHRNVNLAAWSVLTMVNGVVDWLPGAAIEVGGARVRVDTSWPLWSTFDLITTLRATPELGLSWSWNGRHSTRVALVGLEPAAALSHRIRWANWQFEVGVRGGEEGISAELQVRFGAGL